MHEDPGQFGWLISGFQAQIALGIWIAAVLLYGLFRSVAAPRPDTVRPSGPGVG